ncbi:MAG: alanyl-tRNA editing protein [Tibeticola sp.]
MTLDLFRQDATLTACTATITALTPQGIVLDRTVFYPLGGGQAGDTGELVLDDGRCIAIADTRKGKDAAGRPNADICHVPAGLLHAVSPAGLLQTGVDALSFQEFYAALGLSEGLRVQAQIDAPRRRRLMRFHTATHLLCHLVPALVDGCSITPDYARLDFATTEPLDKDALTAGLARLVAEAHPVVVGAITDAELDANPALVKSMSVQPPRGSGVVRTIRIGAGAVPIDFQPCGGTHVANTAEIGAVAVTKIEKKSARTRRVVLGLAD